MTAVAKLLPCPFCGGSAKLTEVEPSAYVVECTNGICNASTNIRFSCGDDARPLVIEQWNRRASTSSSLAKLVEKWIARGYASLPSDQMLINLHVRELQEALASPAELGGVERDVQRALRALTEHEWISEDGCASLAANDIANTIRKLSTPRAAEADWLPIESAPKDGSCCIVTNGVAVGEAWYSASEDGWWWANTHPTDAHDGFVYEPTNWRPLPAPPALTPPSAKGENK